MKLEYNVLTQTQTRGTNSAEYEIYLSFANDGKGGDITNNGKPLKTFEEWLQS
jgi:hypothetical protein